MLAFILVLFACFSILTHAATNDTTCASTNCHIVCQEHQDCYKESFIINASLTKNVIIDCVGVQSCANSIITWDGTQILSSFQLNCIGTNSCEKLKMGASFDRWIINSNITINCLNSNACDTADFYLWLDSSNLNINVKCNSSIYGNISNAYTGACHNTLIDMEATSRHTNVKSANFSNVELYASCDEFDCAPIYFNADFLNYIKWDCNTTSQVFLCTSVYTLVSL